MSDFASYRLSDLVPFSRETLRALSESYNEAIWPSQILFILLSSIILGLVLKEKRARILSALLAAVWLWVGLGYQLKHFAGINWPATYYAWLFVAEALFFLAIGVWRAELRFSRTPIGVVIFLYAAFLHLPVALLLGQSPSQILLFGWGPDLTAVGTLGILLMANGGRSRWALFAPPVLWLLLSALTWWGAKG